jgi:hypothetical protein
MKLLWISPQGVIPVFEHEIVNPTRAENSKKKQEPHKNNLPPNPSDK